MTQGEEIEITEDDPDSDIDVIGYQKDQFPLTRYSPEIKIILNFMSHNV